jgi:hypothetical protein
MLCDPPARCRQVAACPELPQPLADSPLARRGPWCSEGQRLLGGHPSAQWVEGGGNRNGTPWVAVPKAASTRHFMEDILRSLLSTEIPHSAFLEQMRCRARAG